MNSVVQQCGSLTKEDAARLEKIGRDLTILADLSRADILLYCLCGPQRAVVADQVRPHSILPIYDESIVERQVGYTEEPAVLRALTDGQTGVTEVRRAAGSKSGAAKGAPIVQETYPIRTPDGRVIAAVCIETNLIERERHRRRNKVFQQALRQLRQTVLAGELRGGKALTPFAEHDGVLVIDAQHRIQYISGIATSLYRKLGYAGDLLRRRIEDLELDDNGLTLDAMEQARCLEAEVRAGNLVWVKKAIPLFERRRGLRRLLFPGQPARRLAGVLVTIHDDTDRRRQEEEIQVKVTMIQEIHHRVKNNMQTIASLLRLQSRRTESEEVRRALQEGINRILSVAVIHEFLAHQEARVINIRDVSQRIINQIREGILDGERRITLDLRGPNIYLPTQPATVCALVINELLQNALEHGYDRQVGGTVTVSLHDDGEQVTISVDDDGVGLPEQFDLSQTGSMGLQIVRVLAEGDLKGKFELRGRDKGVSAVVTFPKHT
ncbi:MAG: sensor histidine kinase [Anaerolineae bacterium]|nr:sensor histidine kinase [Anaerolineae bacterium]